MQAIVYYLLSDGCEEFDHISEFAPFFEIDKHWDLENNVFSQKFTDSSRKLGCKIFNTHLRWEMMPHGENMRFIYVYRNYKDVVVSFYFHLTNQDDVDGFQGSFDDFLTDWCDGKIIFGNWLQHIQSWVAPSASERYMQSGSSAILVVRYEDMVLKLEHVIGDICTFLNIEMSTDRLNEIAALLSFDSMKRKQSKFMPISVKWKPGFDFIRKGQIGDSDNFFTPEREAKVLETIRKEFPAGIPIWLQQLGCI